MQHIQAAAGEEMFSGYDLPEGKGAFAALLGDGRVIAWGHPEGGGDTHGVTEQLVNVKQVQATLCAFAALREDGSVVTWGLPECGGDSNEVQAQLKNVKHIQGSTQAFAAILEDDRVVTWGSRPLASISPHFGDDEEDDFLLEGEEEADFEEDVMDEEEDEDFDDDETFQDEEEQVHEAEEENQAEDVLGLNSSNEGIVVRQEAGPQVGEQLPTNENCLEEESEEEELDDDSSYIEEDEETLEEEAAAAAAEPVKKAQRTR